VENSTGRRTASKFIIIIVVVVVDLDANKT
jgi:hypothetical protein